MNNIPYFYDALWKEHEVEYLQGYNYIFIKELHYPKEFQVTGIILLFQYDGIFVLRGYNDGIMLPNFNNLNMSKLHEKSRKDRVKKCYDYIFHILKEYNIKNTKIYQNPTYAYQMRYDIINLIYKDFDIRSQLCNLINTTYFVDYMGLSKKQVIKKYIDKKIYNDHCISIYFGDVPNDIFNIFIQKHYNLAGKKTKSDKCWELLKRFIEQKKAILCKYDDNFVYFFISENFCYYGINACTKYSEICTILIYYSIKWIFEHNFKFVYMDQYIQSENIKQTSLSDYKYSLCNELFTNYIIYI
jgi:hypothetical protein